MDTHYSAPHGEAQEGRRRRPPRLHPSVRAGELSAATIEASSPCTVTTPRRRQAVPGLPERVIELHDDGSQEPDDTTDDYCYPEGAYYYVTAADNLE